MPRTGTSFLQQKVFPNLDGIEFYGLETSYYSPAWNRMQYADDTLYDAVDFKRAVDALAGNQKLFSNEWLVGQSVYFNYVNRSMIARRLHEAMPDATIVLVLRGQAEVLKSLYSIALHGWESRSLDDFVWDGANDQHKPHKTTDGAGPAYFNTVNGHEHLDGYLYKPLLDLYTNLFPKVEVLLYEDLLNDPAKIADRFDSIFGTMTPEVRAHFESRTKVHQGVGASQAARLQKMNLGYHAAQSNSVRQRLFNRKKRSILKGEDNTALAFSQAMQKRLTEYYSEANKVLATAYPDLGLERYADTYFLNR